VDHLVAYQSTVSTLAVNCNREHRRLIRDAIDVPPAASLIKLDYDFSAIPPEASPTLWQRVQNGRGKKDYYFKLEMKLRIKVYERLMRLELFCGPPNGIGSSSQLLGHYRLGFKEEPLV
jgi:hypothetical protein